MWVYGLDWAGPGYRQVAAACECGNEPSGSVKCGEFLDQLQTSQLLRKDSAAAAWSECVQFSIDIAKSVALFDGSQGSPACPSDKISMQLKMGRENWWSDTDRGNRSTGR